MRRTDWADFICEECSEHFNTVKSLLDRYGIAYTVDPDIVLRVDYYTKTVFEIASNDIGSQTVVCGGGRYDGLIEELGGAPTPGIGFALGIERLIMVMEKGSVLWRSRGAEAVCCKYPAILQALMRKNWYILCGKAGLSVKKTVWGEV